MSEMKKDWVGKTIKDYDDYNDFIMSVEKLGTPLEDMIIVYTNETISDDEECIICGSKKLIHCVGRYLITGYKVISKQYEYEELPEPIKVCGYCMRLLKENWGISLCFTGKQSLLVMMAH